MVAIPKSASFFFEETSVPIGFFVVSLLHNCTAVKRRHTRDVLMLID